MADVLFPPNINPEDITVEFNDDEECIQFLVDGVFMVAVFYPFFELNWRAWCPTEEVKNESKTE